MRKSKYSESQIAAILQEADAGLALAEVARKHGISAVTFFQRRPKYGGMSVSNMPRLRELAQENPRLKRMYVDLSLDRAVLKEALTKNSDAHAAPRSGGGITTPTASRLNSSLNFLRLDMTLLFADHRPSWKCPR